MHGREDPEKKLEIYIKAGLTKEEVIKKMQPYLNERNREVLLEVIDEYFESRGSSDQTKFVIKAIFGLVVLAVVAYAIFFIFFQSAVYSPTKCLDKPVSISLHGDLMNRDRMMNALARVEEDNCEYFNFIADNAKKIFVNPPGFMSSGQYRGNEDEIHVNSLTGSEHYVASILIHEACHSFQHKQGLEISDNDCTATQYNFLKAVNAQPDDLKAVERIASFWPGYSIKGNDVFEQWKSTS